MPPRSGGAIASCWHWQTEVSDFAADLAFISGGAHNPRPLRFFGRCNDPYGQDTVLRLFFTSEQLGSRHGFVQRVIIITLDRKQGRQVSDTLR